MQSATQTLSVSKSTLWIGYALSALAVLFMVFDSVIKVMMVDDVIESFALLGYPASTAVGIGILSLICIVLYVIPSTAVLGAILMTGYLGGAVATHVRVGSGLFSLVFPVIIGAFLWGGLYLRDRRLRNLIPVRNSPGI